MQSVTVRAPAKVNLQLAVGPRREDGYHDLVNVFHAVSVFDEVTATPATKLRITVEGEAAAAVPTGETNLAAKAARALAAVTRTYAVVPSGGRRVGPEPRIHLHIKKGIPVAGGMAGGSADAAAALVACDAVWQTGLWDTRTGRDTIMEIAADLGADVPFALLGGTAVGVGKGDRLSIALARGTYHWVFALADGGLSTPAVYAECDRLRGDPAEAPKPMASPALMAALSAGDPVALGSALSNDLQQAAIQLRPSSAARSTPVASTGRWARSSPGRGLPAPSLPRTWSTCTTSPLHSRRWASAGPFVLRPARHLARALSQAMPRPAPPGGHEGAYTSDSGLSNGVTRRRRRSAKVERSAAGKAPSSSRSRSSRSAKASSTLVRPAGLSRTRTPRRS